MLKDKAASGEDGEIRYRLHAETAGKLWMLFCVHFQDERPPSHLAGQRFHFGSRHPTGPTPWGPEVDENRHSCCGKNGVEFLRPHIQRFCQRGQRGSACATTAFVGKTAVGHAILRSTTRANPDGRILHDSDSSQSSGCTGEREVTVEQVDDDQGSAKRAGSQVCGGRWPGFTGFRPDRPDWTDDGGLGFKAAMDRKQDRQSRSGRWPDSEAGRIFIRKAHFRIPDCGRFEPD